MKDKDKKTPPLVGSKSFMAVGPTLHYSHNNVQRCWFLALLAYCATCLFFSKILTGQLFVFDAAAATSPANWYLGQYIVKGISIFEYPWQILVLGILMGIMAMTPALIAQLMSWWYCVPFIIAMVLLGNLPLFALFVFVSCIAVASRPLRFRSRFIAIGLCIVPQLIYWGLFATAESLEPFEWGLSFTPWIAAWLIGLTIAAVVLGIGHYTRYRPGLVWLVTAVYLLLAVITFEIHIGFDELDYQMYIAENNPEQASEFYDHNIADLLDEMITNPSAGVKRYIASSFYSDNPVVLREQLKDKIRYELSRDRWPGWFDVPGQLDYQSRRAHLLQQYESFITRRPKSRRMPVALYYKAMLTEYSIDMEKFDSEELLSFYSDYPHERSRQIWYWLYSEFGASPESLEARWRIARYWAGQGRFEQAEKPLAEAQAIITQMLSIPAAETTSQQRLLGPFSRPAETVITAFKLGELQQKISRLSNLISTENRTATAASAKRLAGFVKLNPHSSDYAGQLDDLMVGADANDPLLDNIILARAMMTCSEDDRADKLNEICKQFGKTDGAEQAIYELGLLKIRLWRQCSADDKPDKKRQLLSQARETLTDFIEQYPDSLFTNQVKKNLDALPLVD